MKKFYLLPALFVLLSINVNAQTIESGSISYEEIMKLEIKIEGEMAAVMRDMPKERKSEKILHFNKELSLYENVEKEEESGDMSGFDSPHGGMKINFSEPDNKVFINLEDKKIIEKRDFMTRLFLIESEMPEQAWKINGNQKMILDIPCMEATHTDTSGVVTKVWFAPTIPVSSGPSLFCNLPGMVLGVDVDNGQRSIMATAISMDPPAKDLLKKPRDGKKVTKEEFDEIVAEKMKEMGVDNGGAAGSGAQVIIKIHQ